SQVMVLDAIGDCVKYDFEYTNCANLTSPDDWLGYVGTPDCAATRQAVMYPTDADDEVFIGAESVKRNISYLGITAGMNITVSLTVAASNNNWGSYIYPGTHEFEIRTFNNDPGYYSADFFYDEFCTHGGEVILSGANISLTGITFVNSFTLTQDANWIAIGCCLLSGGIVFDDLEICW
ncbi:hypothetical protein N9Y90_04055, partial [Flavobacteriales bacterium]|nr:hypothetical protein [Flavobacteriales bacterium]